MRRDEGDVNVMTKCHVWIQMEAGVGGTFQESSFDQLENSNIDSLLDITK